MKHTFKTRIYKTGINWCVDVPQKITSRLTKTKGYIRIKGAINGARFTKTLVPVKKGPYRLFVNGAMMKVGKTALGKMASFVIEEARAPSQKRYSLPPLLASQLQAHGLKGVFDQLTNSRKKDILKYLGNIKTQPTLIKNVNKVIAQLKQKAVAVRIP